MESGDEVSSSEEWAIPPLDLEILLLKEACDCNNILIARLFLQPLVNSDSVAFSES